MDWEEYHIEASTRDQGEFSEDFLLKVGSLSTRAKNVLRCLGVKTIEQMIGLSKEECLSIRNCGQTTANEITKLARVFKSHLSECSNSCYTPSLQAQLALDSQYLCDLDRLSTNARNILYQLGASDPRSLAKISEDELRAVQSCSYKTINEILILWKDWQPRVQYIAASVSKPQQSCRSVGKEFEHAKRTLTQKAKRVLSELESDDVSGFINLSYGEVLRACQGSVSTAFELCRLQGKIRFSYPGALAVLPALPRLSSVEDCDRVMESIRMFLGNRVSSLLKRNAVDSLEAFMRLDLDELLSWKKCGEHTADMVLRTQSLVQSLMVCEKNEELPQDDCAVQVEQGENTVPAEGASECFGEDSLIDVCNPSVWLTNWVQEDLARSPNQAKAFMLCMGMLGQPPISQAEAARVMGISRQRVCQLVSAVMERAESSNEIQRLHPILVRVKSIVKEQGGVSSIGDLTRDVFGVGVDGKLLSTATDLMRTLLQSTSWQREGLFLAEGDEVVDRRRPPLSPRLSAITCEIAAGAADEKISDELWSIGRNQLKKALEERVEADGDLGVSRVSDLLLDGVIANCRDKLKQNGDRVYSPALWALQHGDLNSVIGATLERFGRPAHYREVGSEVRKWRCDFTDMQAHTYLSSCENALLWDRGTFVHRRSIEPPLSLIHDVEEWLSNVLADEELPFVSVLGAFSNFESRCRRAGITSEIALYTCLRMSASRSLVYPRIPTIYRREGFSERVPMTIEMERFLQDAGGKVTMQELKDFWLGRVFLKSYQFTLCLRRTNNILRIGDWDCIHIDNIDIDRTALESLIEYTQSVLAKEEHCSIGKIFEEKEVTCKAAGITDSMMLYSLFECYYSGVVNLGRYPIVARGYSDAALESKTIKEHILEYIRDYGKPCPFEALENRFIDELGYREQTVFSVAKMDEIVLYHYGCVLLLETIGWDITKQELLETSAHELYSNSIQAGFCFGRVSSLAESTNLPRLPMGLHWSRTMIAELLKRGGKFLVLGNGQEAFVPKVNPHGITNFESLVGTILHEQWGGGVGISDLQRSLVSYGIVKKSLTRAMLGGERVVTIKSGEVVRRELADA